MLPGKSQRESARSSRYEKELRRLDRRRPRKGLVLVIVLGAFALMAAVEMGRTLTKLRRVDAFASNLGQRSTAELRTDLDGFVVTLQDRNPFIRSGGMAALRVATGWDLGPDPEAWRVRWERERDRWEYRPIKPVSPLSVPTTNPELRALLEKLTNQPAESPAP